MGIIDKLYNKKISALGLAVFRIFYCFVLLAEIIQLFYFRHLIYDKIPFLEQAEINFSIPFVIWIISVGFIILGLCTRFATILNYILGLILIGSIQSYEYHMFYAYMGINFLLVFLPVSKELSVDRLILKLKYSNTRFYYNPPQTVSVLSYFVPILLGIAFVYFDSIFFKTTSKFWMNGLGVWLPTSIPPVINVKMQWILNNEFLMYFLGYLTLLFETIFIFTFYKKKWRVPLLIIGLGLHIGILLAYPIPWFALGVSTIYLLMVPVSFWERLGIFFKSKKSSLTFYYDAECPLCNRTKIIIQHFDILHKVEFKTVQYFAHQESLLKDISNENLLEDIHSIRRGKVYTGLDTYIQVLDTMVYTKPLSWLIRLPGIYHIGKLVYGFISKNRNTERCTEDNCGYTPPQLPSQDEKIKLLKNYTLRDLKVFTIKFSLVVLVLLQLITSYNSGILPTIRYKLGIQNNIVNQNVENSFRNIQKNTQIYLGITGHSVFIDYHFSEYNHVIAVVYKDSKDQEIWLPIINSDGTPGNYLYGFNWAKWSFRVNGNKISQKNLEKGIRDFTAFWSHKNGVSLKDAKFVVKLKKIETPNGWEKDFLTHQMEKPWVDIGLATWSNNEYNIDIPIVEEL